MKLLVSTFLFFATSLGGVVSYAQEATPLRKEILAVDKLLFEEGFNQCDMEKLRGNLHPDLEFLHDMSGETNFEQFFSSIQTHICGIPDGKLTRTLVPKSSTVYPMKNGEEIYAAVQTGKHEFHFTPNGEEPMLSSTAQFVHVYFLVDGKWLLKRVISYDHQSPQDQKQSN